MNAARVAALALIVALVGLGVAMIRRPTEVPLDSGTGARTESSGTVQREFSQLAARVEALEANGLRDMVQPTRVELAPRDPADLEIEGDGHLEGRITELERELAGMRAELDSWRSMFGLDRTSHAPSRTLEDWTQQALDPASSPEDMVAALGALRRRRLDDGSDARIPILQPLLNLVQSSEDGHLRENIWRQMSGVTDPSLLPVLLDALANDPHAGAREEAAETLADFMPNPAAESALMYSLEFDDDADVREQAAESLGKIRR